MALRQPAGGRATTQLVFATKAPGLPFCAANACVLAVRWQGRPVAGSSQQPNAATAGEPLVRSVLHSQRQGQRSTVGALGLSPR